MYTLAQTNSLESNKGTTYTVQAPELEEIYQNAGYQKHERSYKLKYQHKEYTVSCPEYRNDKIGAEPIIIVPVFLIPRRPYPVHVYLYAIDLYSSNPTMGQRQASEMTRKTFGLTHFAHTTLGRTLKIFVRNIEKTAPTSEECRNVGLREPCDEDVDQHTNGTKCEEHENDVSKQSGFPTTHATAAWRGRAARILELKINRTTLKQFIETCFELAKEWFKKRNCFLL